LVVGACMSVAIALIAGKPRLVIVFRRDRAVPQPNRMAALER